MASPISLFEAAWLGLVCARQKTNGACWVFLRVGVMATVRVRPFFGVLSFSAPRQRQGDCLRACRLPVFAMEVLYF